jgi:hypothetical protein
LIAWVTRCHLAHKPPWRLSVTPMCARLATDTPALLTEIDPVVQSPQNGSDPSTTGWIDHVRPLIRLSKNAAACLAEQRSGRAKRLPAFCSAARLLCLPRFPEFGGAK